MRPVPIPDAVAATFPGAMRGVLAAPGGDLTDPDIAPVEVLFDGLVDGGFQRAFVRLALEDGDLEQLIAGGHVWLIF
ncbi:MAG: hypothetical protein ABW000_07215 [Actinoplanes sp.]